MQPADAHLQQGVASYGEANLWDHVDDFQWLKPGLSPNWRPLDLNDQRAVPDNAWESIGGMAMGEDNTQQMLELARLRVEQA